MKKPIKSITNASQPIPTRKVFKDKKKYDRKKSKLELKKDLEQK